MSSSNLYIKAQSDSIFDYSDLDSECLDFVQQQTGEIRLLMKRTAQDIIEIGQRLIEVKKLLGYGQYRKWIQAEFNWGKSTANSFENVAKQFANVQNLDGFAASALYELAAPSTPEAARKEAIALAKAGNRIGYKVAKEIKQRHSLKISREQSSVQVESKHSLSNKTKGNVKKPAISLQQFPKQEIIEVYPQAVREKSVENNVNQKTSNSGSWWQLGNHYLYCGEPSSSQFHSLLPDSIALAVAFPSTVEWSWGNLEKKINSSLTLFSSYEDVDLKLFREMLRNVLELYTEGQETVCFAFVPDPALLLLAESLDCQCFIAESNQELCQAIIQAWKQMGGSATALSKN